MISFFYFSCILIFSYHQALTYAISTQGFGLCSDGVTHGFSSFEALNNHISTNQQHDSNKSTTYLNEALFRKSKNKYTRKRHRSRNSNNQPQQKVSSRTKKRELSDNFRDTFQILNDKVPLDVEAQEEENIDDSNKIGIMNSDLVSEQDDLIVQSTTTLSRNNILTLCPGAIFVFAPDSFLDITTSMDIVCGNNERESNELKECIFVGVGMFVHIHLQPNSDFDNSLGINLDKNDLDDNLNISVDSGYSTVSLQGITFKSNDEVGETETVQLNHSAIVIGDIKKSWDDISKGNEDSAMTNIKNNVEMQVNAREDKVKIIDCRFEELSTQVVINIITAPMNNLVSDEIIDNTNEILRKRNRYKEQIKGAGEGWENLEVYLIRSIFLQNFGSSIVTNIGGHLIVKEALFKDNIVNKNMILVKGGQLSMEDTCFQENKYELLDGLVMLHSDSKLVANANNFISGNKKKLFNEVQDLTLCDGIFLEPKCTMVDCGNIQSCQTFKNGICENRSTSLTPVGPSLCSDGLTMGYSSLSILKEDIRLLSRASSSNSTELILCPFTTFLFKEDVDAIEISSDNIKIKCGREGSYFNQCIFEGGKHHFWLVEGASGIVLSGITLKKATEVSVIFEGGNDSVVWFDDCIWESNYGETTVLIIEVRTSNDKTSEVKFTKCMWKHNNGKAIIKTLNKRESKRTNMERGLQVDGEDYFYTSTVMNNTKDVDNGYYIIEDDEYYSTGMNETKDELAIIIYRCYFLANQADNTMISVFGSNLNVIETIFSRNKVLGSIVEIENGVISISRSCFEKNVMSNSVMLINPQTSMGNEITNYCYENVKPNAVESDTSNMCNGILTDNECYIFSSDSCKGSICYTDLNSLSSAISLVGENDIGRAFSLCPETVFDFNSLSEENVNLPININTSNIVIQCGHHGLQTDQCIIFGGDIQFKITGSPKGVRFYGITMIGSKRSSIKVVGNNAEIAFIDCEWSRHIGSEVVYAKADKGNGLSSIDDSPWTENQVQKLIVRFNHCNFLDNIVKSSIISSFSVKVEIMKCNFLGNKAQDIISTRTLAITPSVSNSCFMSNNILSPGTIMVKGNASALIRSNFLRLMHDPTDKQCNGIYYSEACTDDELLNDRSLCDGHCLPFLSSTCIIQTYLSLPILIETPYIQVSDIPTTVTVLTTPPTVTVLTAIPTTGTIVSVPGNKPATGNTLPDPSMSTSPSDTPTNTVTMLGTPPAVTVISNIPTTGTIVSDLSMSTLKLSNMPKNVSALSGMPSNEPHSIPSHVPSNIHINNLSSNEPTSEGPPTVSTATRTIYKYSEGRRQFCLLVIVSLWIY